MNDFKLTSVKSTKEMINVSIAIHHDIYRWTWRIRCRLNDLNRLVTIKQSWTSLFEDFAVNAFESISTNRIKTSNVVFLMILSSHVVSMNLLYSRFVNLEEHEIIQTIVDAKRFERTEVKWIWFYKD